MATYDELRAKKPTYDELGGMKPTPNLGIWNLRRTWGHETYAEFGPHQNAWEDDYLFIFCFCSQFWILAHCCCHGIATASLRHYGSSTCSGDLPQRQDWTHGWVENREDWRKGCGQNWSEGRSHSERTYLCLFWGCSLLVLVVSLRSGLAGFLLCSIVCVRWRLRQRVLLLRSARRSGMLHWRKCLVMWALPRLGVGWMGCFSFWIMKGFNHVWGWSCSVFKGSVSLIRTFLPT